MFETTCPKCDATVQDHDPGRKLIEREGYQCPSPDCRYRWPIKAEQERQFYDEDYE